MKRSKNNAGFLYFLEKIVRSHPLPYFIVRQFIRYTNIFEENAASIEKMTNQMITDLHTKEKKILDLQVTGDNLILVLGEKE